MKLAFFAFVNFSLIPLLSCLAPDIVTKEDFLDLQRDVQDLSRKINAIMSVIELMGQTAIPVQSENNSEFLNDTTIEERVALLEFQVAGHTDDITNLETDLEAVEDEVTIISTGQISQDERILELEIDADGFEDSIESLLAADTEQNIELASLTNTVKELNTTLSAVDADVTAVEITVTELDSRLEQLEVSGTVAFQAELNQYTSIPVDSVIVFDVVDLNIGNGYNSSTGEFIVPVGGAGLYFFYTNLLVISGDYVIFKIKVNSVEECKAESETENYNEATCGFSALLTEGDVVHVYYDIGIDDTPVSGGTGSHNIFTGFRIAPQ